VVHTLQNGARLEERAGRRSVWRSISRSLRIMAIIGGTVVMAVQW
jgi:hypothetical protein